MTLDISYQPWYILFFFTFFRKADMLPSNMLIIIIFVMNINHFCSEIFWNITSPGRQQPLLWICRMGLLRQGGISITHAISLLGNDRNCKRILHVQKSVQGDKGWYLEMIQRRRPSMGTMTTRVDGEDTTLQLNLSWWRHQMESFSPLLAICAGNSPIPGESPQKGQWRGALMFSLICVWIKGRENNREAGDLRRYRAHYDAIVMVTKLLPNQLRRLYSNGQRYGEHIASSATKTKYRFGFKNLPNLKSCFARWLKGDI